MTLEKPLTALTSFMQQLGKPIKKSRKPRKGLVRTIFLVITPWPSSHWLPCRMLVMTTMRSNWYLRKKPKKAFVFLALFQFHWDTSFLALVSCFTSGTPGDP